MKEATSTIKLIVGDLIEFNYFGQLKKGHILLVGKHGYLIDSGGMYTGYIRCDFDKAIKIG